MLDVNNAVQLNVKKNTARVISTTLVILTAVILMILLWVIITKDDVGEDWLLTLIALFPSILIITSGWFYIQLAKKSLNSDELLQQTFEILCKDVPLALRRRMLYYTEMYDPKSKFFTNVNSSRESLLDLDYLDKQQTEDYISIKSNVILGLNTCRYKIEGRIIDEYPLINNLTIGLQLNINQVEAIYTFNNLNSNQGKPSKAKINKLKKQIHLTTEGAESAGHNVRIIENNGSLVFKARMSFKDVNPDANLLLDSCDRLFFVQDFSLMTGSMINQLKGFKL